MSYMSEIRQAISKEIIYVQLMYFELIKEKEIMYFTYKLYDL